MAQGCLRTLLQFNASAGNLRLDPQLGRAGLTWSGKQAVCEGWGLTCCSFEVLKLICSAALEFAGWHGIPDTWSRSRAEHTLRIKRVSVLQKCSSCHFRYPRALFFFLHGGCWLN